MLLLGPEGGGGRPCTVHVPVRRKWEPPPGALKSNISPQLSSIKLVRPQRHSDSAGVGFFKNKFKKIYIKKHVSTP